MKYRKLGERGPLVSVVGFGAWGISGRDWGNTDDNLSRKAIHAAIDSGVNFIDTADVYGFGHSEELIRKVLDERGGKKNVIIATKAGNNFYPHSGEEYKLTPINSDYSVRHLEFAAEQSLKRLKVEILDIFQLHSPDTEILEHDEPWLALEKLKKAGKIRHPGWSVQSFRETEQAPFLERHHDLLDVIQVRYNLLERQAEDILLPMAVKYRTGVIVRIPLLFGLLSGKFTRETRFGDNDHRKNNLSPEKLAAYIDDFGSFKPFFKKYSEFTPAQLSLRFCLSNTACHTVIPGGKTEEQVRENIKASELDFIPFEAYPGKTLDYS